jgi:myo-inositol-1(or 4)-monophosphatase
MLPLAISAARAAGQVLKDWSESFTVREKRPADLVTEADVASQEAIHKILRERFPDHGYLGEEGLDLPSGDSPYCWIIDPLDGTSNYVHRFPYYAVSIGLEKNGELFLGVVYDPSRDEMFTAIEGQPAQLNGQPIQPTLVDSLKQAMVVASLPIGADRDNPAVTRFLQVMPEVQSIQRTGSAALNLAYVAAGRMDAFWSSSLKPWDVAAGAMIVRQAGGRVSKMDNSPSQTRIPDLLASNGTALHDRLVELLT